MRRDPSHSAPEPPRIAAPADTGTGRFTLRVADEPVSLLGDRALLWRGVLVVADVHLGKGDHFRARGLPLPPGELDDDLARLAQLVAATGAHTVRVLGDLVHGALKPATVERVAQWRAELPAALELVPGNHDRHEAELPAAWRVDRLPAVHREGPFAFVHAPGPVAGAYVWAGHVHPTAAFRGKADRLRFPCFVVGEALGLVPAFSRFTGGPVVREAPEWRRYACVEGEVLEM